MRLFLFITVFFISFFSAQSHKGFRWIGRDHSLFSVDLRTGMLTKGTKKNEIIELGKIQKWDSIKRELPGDFDINTFHHKKKFLVSIPGTGQLYDFDVSNLVLRRLDKTFFRGYNFNANQFLRKDTIFSIGGEGFWQKHSIITFYNSKTLEWDLYKSQNENPTPSNFNFSGYSPKNDAFFSAYVRDDSVLYGKDIPFSIYFFKNKKWSVMGNLNEKLKEAFGKENYRSVWTGEYLILYKSNKTLQDVMIVDPFNNILFTCRPLKEHFFLSISEIYYHDGYLYSRDFVSSGNHEKLSVDSTSVRDLVNQSVRIGKAYEENNYSIMTIIGIVFVLLIIFGWGFYRKYFKKTAGDLSFSDLELSVIKEIINNPIERKFTTLEINTLLDINTKSYDNQRQIRNRVISGINHKLYSFFDSKDFICRSPNIDDKRMMDYYLNPEIRKREIKILHKQIFEN